LPFIRCAGRGAGTSDLKLDSNQLKSFARAVSQKLRDLGVPKYVAIIASAAAVSAILSGYFSEVVCNLAGFIYPVYASYKAILSPSTEDDTQWLTYWVIYGFLTVGESFTSFVVSRLPLYQVAKVLFLLWCFLPYTQGAQVIFQRFVRPFMASVEKPADDLLRRTQRHLQQLADDVTASARSGDGAGIADAISQAGPVMQGVLTDAANAIIAHNTPTKDGKTRPRGSPVTPSAPVFDR
jgi:receptor expression-enhancing protein 5/6